MFKTNKQKKKSYDLVSYSDSVRFQLTYFELILKYFN